MDTDQVQKIIQAQAELAAASLRRGFPIPGIGVLVSRDTPERHMRMVFGPKAGQGVTIPPKKLAKSRVSKIIKDVFFGNPNAMPDVLMLDWYPSDEPQED